MIVRVVVVKLFPNMSHVQGKMDDQGARCRPGTGDVLGKCGG